MQKYFNRITTILVFGVAAVVFGVFLLWPMFQEFSRIEQELNQYTDALLNKEKYVFDLARLASRLDARQEAVQKIETAIPDETSIPALFDLIQKMNINSGLVLTSISASVAEEGFADSDLVVTTVSLESIGSYDALKEFISQVRKSVQLLEITSISFETTIAKSEEGAAVIQSS